MPIGDREDDKNQAERDQDHNVEKLAHDPLSIFRRTGSASAAGVHSPAIAVQPFTHFLAGLEKRHALLIHRHMRTRPRIAAGTGGAMLYRKSAKTTQFDPIAPRQSGDDLIENCVNDILDIPLVEVRVMLGDTLNEFGFDHRDEDPGKYGHAFP